MPDNRVELTVRSQLARIVEELGGIQEKVKDIEDGFQKMGDSVEDTTKKQVSATEKMLTGMGNLGRRVLTHLADDFKALMAVESLVVGLKFSEQFKGSVRDTVELHNAIRKLGGVFGIAKQDFASFQSDMIRGLGEIGVESDAAARALQGLSETPVRGKDALIEYAKIAGQLGIIGGQRGREDAIAGGIARVITARGGNASDTGQMKGVADSLARIRQVTGKSPTDALEAMERIYAGMPKDMRRIMGAGTMEGLASAAVMGGPNATQFLEKFLSLSETQRAGLEARGVGKIIGPQGINTEALQRFGNEAKTRGKGDLRLGMKAMGISSDEAAEGAIRLVDQIDRLSSAQEKLGKTTVDLIQMQRDAATMGEAWSMNVSKIKSKMTALFSDLPHLISKGLTETSKSTAAATGVVAGGGVLAALLMGGGLRGIGGFLGKGLGRGIGGTLGGVARAGATEMITGRQVVPVYVTNANEMGGGLGAAGAMGIGGMFGKLGKAAGWAGAGIGAFLAGRELGKALGLEKIGEKLGDKLYDFFSKTNAGPGMPHPFGPPAGAKVTIEDKSGKLQPSGNPSRGVDYMRRRIY